jgi:hypothetical protein
VRRSGLAALAALVVLVAPAPALADSIVFVRDGDVWISTPDGATERRLTVGGGHGSPSMADDGTIVALRGSSFVRLRTDGAPVGTPTDAIGGDWLVAGGPYDARVSPDGLKIAYWFSGRRRACLPLDPSCSFEDRELAAYAYADRTTDPLELGAVRERRDPSWYGSGRALLFRPGPGSGEAVAVNRVGRGESDNQGWFSYDDGTELEQGQISRGGDRLAAVAGGDEIHLFGVVEPPPVLPALRCIIPGGPFSNPTWSPDGTMLAWQAPDGVHVGGPVPDLRRPVEDCSVIRERLLAPGSEPYWGPADVPGATSAPPPLGEPVARRPARAFSALRVTRRQRGRAVRLSLRIARGPARVEARLLRGRRGAGRALRRRARAGTLRLRVPLNRAARRALARRGRLALGLRVSVRAPGARAATARRGVVLRPR